MATHPSDLRCGMRTVGGAWRVIRDEGVRSAMEDCAGFSNRMASALSPPSRGDDVALQSRHEVPLTV